MFGQNKSQRILKEKQPTVDDKYGPHFEYTDLCKRLKKVKSTHTDKSLNLKTSAEPVPKKKAESYVVGGAPEKTCRKPKEKAKKPAPKVQVRRKVKQKVIHKSEGRLKKPEPISNMHMNVLKRTRSKVSKYN